MEPCSVETEPLPGPRSVLRTRFLRGGAPLSWADVLAAWRDDDAFARAFDATLAGAPFDALFWETPPLTGATLERPYEHVLVDAPALARMPVDAEAFRRALRGPAAVRRFPNLGGDALLVAPARRGPLEAYPHLAAFCRRAPEDQRRELWRQVAGGVAERLEARGAERALWVSTSGLGVAWLHVRIDAAPKYYTHAPYREA